MTDVPRIKTLRTAIGWSQGRMARYLRLSQASVSNMENGQEESGPVSALLDQLEENVRLSGAVATSAEEAA